VLGGARHFFRPAQGTILLGVAQVGAAAVLLAALGEQLAWIHVEGKSPKVIFVGALDVVEVDAERMLRLSDAPTTTRPSAVRTRASREARSQAAANDGPVPAPPKVVRASASTEAHHDRILQGPRLDPTDEARVERVLRRGFADILRRALAPANRPKGGKLLGKKTVRLVLWMLCELAIRGRGDVADMLGQIAAWLRRNFPERRITDYALRKALILILNTGTCILGRDGNTWVIKIGDLRNPTSARHRQFCEETGDGCSDDALMLDEMPPTSAVSAGRAANTRAGESAPAANMNAADQDLESPTGSATADELTAREVPRAGSAAAGEVSSTPAGVASSTGSRSVNDPAPTGPTSGPSSASRKLGLSDFEAGFSYALMLCLLALVGDGPTTEEKRGETADEKQIETPPRRDDGGSTVELNAGPSEADAGDQEIQQEPAEEPSVVSDCALDVRPVVSETVGEPTATGPDNVDVADEVQPGQAPIERGAREPAGADYDVGDVGEQIAADPGDADEVAPARHVDLDLGDEVPLEVVSAEGADDGGDVSNMVGAAVDGPHAAGTGDADADEGREVGDAVDELTATGSSLADVGDEAEFVRAPVGGDAAGPSDDDAARECHAGEPVVAAAAGDEVQGGQAQAEADDGRKAWDAAIEPDTPDRVEPPDDPDNRRPRAAPAASPRQDLLGILGPRGPPRSR
ncbi:MAG TPA: hypothetical protein PKW35_19930, partial [Nannocystaceae bacterium]|nr:hypothetical protein [Nannocystaceae bacterium]